MNIKTILQIIISLTIASILLAFYYTFFSNKDKEELDLSKSVKEKIITNKNVLSELINIEYNSTDEEGNTYYINAEKATVDQLNPDKNEVTMEGVISIISLKNKVPIIIYAKNATYNKINNNTYFYNDINIDYLDKSIYAENLDLIFTEKVSKVYNNVILNSDNFNLYTDRILIDMISGDVKLGVINNSEKVKFIKK
tara:strand:- start:821 stop:1411 length:591 start_codon:yes stop_codon:yes gene_type:complete